MPEKIRLLYASTKASFSDQRFKKYWHTVTGLLVLGLLLVAPNIYAGFVRTAGDEGYGYGYGFDTDTEEFGYGYGYLSSGGEISDGVLSLDAENFSVNAILGGVTVAGTNSAATSVTFDLGLTVSGLSTPSGNASITIPQGAVITKTGGGAFDFTALTSGDVTNLVSGITGRTSQGSIEFGVTGVGLTSDVAVTISIPVPTSLNGTSMSVYKSNSLNSSWTLLGTCTVASGLCTFTSTTFSYFAATTSSGTSTGSGGGGGSGVAPTVSTTPFNGIQTPVGPGALVVTPPESAMVPADVSALLAFLGVPRDNASEQKAAKDITADFKQFGLKTSVLTQFYAAVNFTAYGNTVEAQKLGMGERRAVMRDYMDTVGRIPTTQADWADVQRIITGSKPVGRNISKEQAQLPKVLALFEKLYGHLPIFSKSSEDLAWNFMMYRIRPAKRILTTESQGVALFKNRMKRVPVSPQDWAAVKALAYVLQ